MGGVGCAGSAGGAGWVGGPGWARVGEARWAGVGEARWGVSRFLPVAPDGGGFLPCLPCSGFPPRHPLPRPDDTTRPPLPSAPVTTVVAA
ncbi:hypothetical protein DF268_25565 [Streptomyces sp. V2]|nr:hypothetical protein DF268_25565 [Streptomyces sp. V2]